MSWEEKVQAQCDALGAVCRHSRQSPNGDKYNFDMTCRFVPSTSGRLYSVANGESNARLHCVGCSHFAHE